MARNVYYPYDFEAHKNLSHKQFPISVYYFIDGAVVPGKTARSNNFKSFICFSISSCFGYENTFAFSFDNSSPFYGSQFFQNSHFCTNPTFFWKKGFFEIQESTMRALQVHIFARGRLQSARFLDDLLNWIKKSVHFGADLEQRCATGVHAVCSRMGNLIPSSISSISTSASRPDNSTTPRILSFSKNVILLQ